MRHHMGSTIRVTSAHSNYVIGVEVPTEVAIMSWLSVYD